MHPISRAASGIAVAALLWACASSSQADAEDPSLPVDLDSGVGEGSRSDAGSADGASASDDGGIPRACPVTPSTDPLVVAIERGMIRGKRAGTGYAFLGIPYAKPPVGSLRLMPPVTPECFRDVKEATSFGNTCVQTPLALNSKEPVVGDEDCLTLNVWTPSLPSSSSNESLPVLVWKHGGFFVHGSSNLVGENGVNLYDGQALANEHKAVVVTFNYRIGALGFLAHPALAAANAEHTTGNYALLDALHALRWVQDNIASFNGDKSRVMLFGESAGATDTCALVASPLAKGLFASAIMQSGNCSAETREYRYEDEASIVDELKCSKATDVVACLQGAPVSAFVTAGGNKVAGTMLLRHTINVDPVHFQNVPIGPTVDDYFLTDIPLKTIRAGKHNHVPLVIGTTSEELAWLLPHSLVPAIPVASCVEFAAIVNVMFPGATHPGLPRKLLAEYRCNPLDPESGYRELIAMTSDAFFTCPSRRALVAAAKTQTEPLYRYFYTHTHSSGSWAPLGAAHAGELPFVWGQFGWFGMTPTSAETTLSKQMQGYWTNFARSFDPNGAGLPRWEKWDPKVDNVLQFETPVKTAAGIHTTACDIWDSVQD